MATVSLLGLAPGGVYLARQVTSPAGELLPHRFTLTTSPRLYGGLLSAALSLTLRPVGVTDHPALWSPDFPLASRASDRPLRFESLFILLTLPRVTSFKLIFQPCQYTRLV